MVAIEDWQARLMLRIMNTAARYYPDTTSNQHFSDIETLRAVLEGQVGTVTQLFE
jgi:hypothetical protein